MARTMRIGEAMAMRRTLTVLTVLSALWVSGCSSVPDAVNPVEWYRGASGVVGGWFGDDEQSADVPPEPGTVAQPGYPNLATVPQRPQASTTAAEREAMTQGLIADRANARYSSEAAGPRPIPTTAPAASSRAAPTAPPPEVSASAQPARAVPEPVAALPSPSAEPAPAVASSPQTQSSNRSALWPNRPAPDTPGLTGATSARVAGGAQIRQSGSEPVPAPLTRVPAPRSSQTAERTTTLDSTGTASRIPPPPAVITTERVPREPTRTAAADAVAPSPAASRQPTASSQSVIVNEDAIYAAPAARSFSGQAYLASTVYFGHGSANLTAGERQEIARVAQAALANGAGVQVIGHASSRTADLSLRDHEVANLAISLRRAEAVADALIAAGIPANRVLVEAVSNTRPEFFEVMPAGEAGNRRAEIFLIY